MSSPSERDFFAKQISRQLERITDDLRESADRIERLQKDVARIGEPGHANAGRIAASTYKEITTLLMNTPADLLISAAGDYDQNV
jgi:hypothetical protein